MTDRQTVERKVPYDIALLIVLSWCFRNIYSYIRRYISSSLIDVSQIDTEMLWVSLSDRDRERETEKWFFFYQISDFLIQ